MAEVRKNTVHPLHIEGYTAEGMGVARLDGRVVFIPGTIRGEDWEVQLLKVNKGVAWGKGTRLISPSPVRQEPDCPYSGRCGGCQYRHMSYVEELAEGTASLINILRPEAVAFGGGVAGAPEHLLLEPLRRRVGALCFSRHGGRATRILRAELGNAAGVIGAALLGRVI